MSRSASHPQVRSDLVWFELKHRGPIPRFLVRDPRTGEVAVLSAKERYVCTRLDGRTPPETIAQAFESEFGQSLDRGQLDALIRLLGDQGWLENADAVHAHPALSRLRPLPISADSWFQRLAAAFAWTYSPPGRAAYWAYILLGMLAVAATRAEWWPVLRELDQLVAWISVPGVWSWERMWMILAVAVAAPLLKEIPKGVTCRHYGARVPHLYFGWVAYVLPRITPDLSEIRRLHRDAALRVVSAGIRFELFLFATGALGAMMLRPENPTQQFMQVIAVVSAIQLLLNANPLGRQDGGLWWSVRAGIPDYRRRAVRMFRAWMLGRSFPEPLPTPERRRYIRYGALAELYAWTLRLAVIGLLAYILTRKFGGFGALLWAAGMILQYREDVVDAIRRIRAARRRDATWSRWRPHAAPWRFALLAAATACIAWGLFRPGVWSAVADFEVRPQDTTLVRSRINGLLESIEVAVGDEIAQGQVVAQISRRQLETQRAMAAAALRRGEALLHAAEVGLSEAEVAIFEQAVALTEAALGYSEREVQRYARLHERQAVSGQPLDAALRRRDEEADMAAIAQSALVKAQAGVPPQTIAALHADVDALRRWVDDLDERLADAVLSAESAGRVVWVLAEGRPGARVRAGDALLRVESTGPLRLRLAVPESHAASVAVGARVAGRTRAYPSMHLTGRVAQVLPVAVGLHADAQRRSVVRQEGASSARTHTTRQRYVPVIVELDDPTTPRLYTGMTGIARIAGTEDRSPAPIPSALLRFLHMEGWSWIP